jgi:hypothetical protein
MITAIVTFGLSAVVTYDMWSEIAAAAAPRFENFPGLVREQFLFNHGLGGGVNLWESREAAEACYAAPWRESIGRVAFDDPRIEYFDTPVVVDNSRGGIVVEAVG